MKFLHTGDLHIGKVVNEFSMIEDQKDILAKIIQIAKEEQVDGIIIAGDVYDRSIPPAEAVTLLDWFLTEFVRLGKKVFLISGNHDSAERLDFGSSIMEAKGVYVAGTYNGDLKTVLLEEGDLKVELYLLPFIKPQTMRYYADIEKEGDNSKQPLDSMGTLEDQEEQDQDENSIRTYEEGVRYALKDVTKQEDRFQLLVTHHFVTAGGVSPELSDSENGMSIGGIDNVDTSTFDSFDYVALGHIHRAQRIGRDTIRYAGTPLKYSFSECSHIKSVTILEIDQEKHLKISTRELTPLHDMRKIKGNLKDLMNPEYYQLADVNDYIQATLTDEVELMDPIGTLRSVYPNVMQILISKNSKEQQGVENALVERKNKTPMELFEEFFTAVTDREFDETRKEIMKEVIDQTMGGEK